MKTNQIVKMVIGLVLVVGAVVYFETERQPKAASLPIASFSAASSTIVYSASNTAFKKPADAELRQKLTTIQYNVTQQNGTEQPFNNAYWDNHEAGIYVDVVSGVPLFSSTDKYDSGTGWPSFTKPIDASAVQVVADDSLGMSRTEVRSVSSNDHLGHLFDDGPAPLGTRYCMNSAALKFIPKADLVKDGYGQYQSLFQ